jgi:hypothetical protein
LTGDNLSSWDAIAALAEQVTKLTKEIEMIKREGNH